MLKLPDPRESQRQQDQQQPTLQISCAHFKFLRESTEGDTKGLAGTPPCPGSPWLGETFSVPRRTIRRCTGPTYTRWQAKVWYSRKTATPAPPPALVSAG